MSISGLIPHDDSDETNAQRAIKLLKKVSDEELADIYKEVLAEQNHRLQEAEKKLTDMKRAFGRCNRNSSPSGTKVTENSTNPLSTRGARAKKKGKDKRAPRGKAKELIVHLLKDGSKSRKQIESHFRDNGLLPKSVGTLLNRLKTEERILHNEESKMYTIASKEGDVIQ